jgi:hypothetical protein
VNASCCCLCTTKTCKFIAFPICVISIEGNTAKVGISCRLSESKGGGSGSLSKPYPTKHASFFEYFPYVCPEPVLVERSFLVSKWLKYCVFSHRARPHQSNPLHESPSRQAS